MAQEMKKMNTLGASSSASSSSNSTFRDGIQKLAYLANLLDVSVSYSDFPKVIHLHVHIIYNAV